MIDHQYRENGARNLYLIYNRIKAYLKHYPNQSKEFYSIENFMNNPRNFEDSGKILAGLVSESYQNRVFHRTLTSGGNF